MAASAAQTRADRFLELLGLTLAAKSHAGEGHFAVAADELELLVDEATALRGELLAAGADA